MHAADQGQKIMSQMLLSTFKCRAIALLTALLTVLLLPVAIADDAVSQGPSFTNDVIPLLTRYDCNSGGCHGKLSGQNGFRLSLRGYAPEDDHESLTRESRGRRLNAAAPAASLLLTKASGGMPHGGGRRFAPEGRAAQMLLAWISAGAPGPLPEEARLKRLHVEPQSAVLQVGENVQLQVRAEYDDGSSRDVTWLARFASGDAGMLDVSDQGLVTALRSGEHIVRVSFQELVEVTTLTMPAAVDVQPEWYAARSNRIDEEVFSKLQTLRIVPAAECDDATFLRRAMLDAIGTLPTPDEVRAFLADPDPNRRSRLIDSLLERPEYADYWALQLGDLLQNRVERDHDVRGRKGVRGFHRWIREQIAEGRTWRQIARDVLLAEGSCEENPAVGYYIVTIGEKSAEDSEVADSAAQAFLGTRIGCARCHNHPLEKYTQDDYYHFVSFFSRLALDRRQSTDGATMLQVSTRHIQNLQKQHAQQVQKRDELMAQIAAAAEASPPAADSAEKDAAEKGAAAEIAQQQQELENISKRLADLERQIEEARQSPVTVRQPRTGQQLSPRPLDRSEVTIAAGADPRVALVDWLTDDGVDYFSGAMVNRLWKHFMGTGLVEPVDDLRATNPPSNQALWDYLNSEFVATDFDLKELMRLIMNSRTYQLSAATNPGNAQDQRFYSHAQARRLPAEVLLDAICAATGEPETFGGYPRGMRVIQIPDPGVDSWFLTVFGRSQRVTACACERAGDVTLPQLLHLQNGEELTAKIQAGGGRLQQLLAAGSEDETLVRELFLASLSRQPTGEELAAVHGQLSSVEQADRPAVFQDLFWALLNSREFAFQH